LRPASLTDMAPFFFTTSSAISPPLPVTPPSAGDN